MGSLGTIVGGERHVADKMKPYLIFVAILINFSGHSVSGATTGPRPHGPFSEPENPKMVDSEVPDVDSRPPPQMGRMAGLPKLPYGGQPTTGTYQTQTYPLNGYQTTQTTGYQAPTTYGQQNTGYQPTTYGTPTTTAVVPVVPVAPVPVTDTPVTHACRFTEKATVLEKTTKEDCGVADDKKQCTWYANECIHKTEKIYIGLDARLKKRGKTNLALQIFYNKKPAEVQMPYGPFGYYQVNAFKQHQTYPHYGGGTYGYPSYGNGYYGQRYYGNYGYDDYGYGQRYGGYGGYKKGYEGYGDYNKGYGGYGDYGPEYGYDRYEDDYEYGYKGDNDYVYKNDYDYKGGYEDDYEYGYEPKYEYGYKSYESRYGQGYGRY